LSTNELKCINLSRKAKLVSAREYLSELKANKLDIENPLGDLSGGITWGDSIYQRTKQVMLLPIVLLFTILTYAAIPPLYILDLWDEYLKKRKVKSDIKELENEILQAQLPTNKVLAELWRLHGMCSRKYSSDEIVRLLRDWINILYGEDVCKKLQLNNRVREISARQMTANSPYYKDKSKAAHFHFVALVNVLINELTFELPAYE